MTPASTTAFVTGGAGFIGSHLVEALLRRGYGEVRCLVRGERRWLDGLDVTLVRGDLADREALRAGARGVDYVYHLAGVTRARNTATFERINHTATLDLLEVVREVNPGVKNVLVTSSLAAVGPVAGGVADESMPLRPISAYGRSKAALERALAAPGDDGKTYFDALPLVVARPSLVYGPRDRQVLPFFKLVRRGVCPMIGSGRTPELSLVHVRDLVRGFIAAAEADATAGETYFLGSERHYAWREVKEAMAAALGRKALAIPVPGALAGPIGSAVEGVSRLVGAHPVLSRVKAREMRDACKRCSVEKARRHFGYRQEVSLEAGMRETAGWYKAEGWL